MAVNYPVSEKKLVGIRFEEDTVLQFDKIRKCVEMSNITINECEVTILANDTREKLKIELTKIINGKLILKLRNVDVEQILISNIEMINSEILLDKSIARSKIIEIKVINMKRRSRLIVYGCEVETELMNIEQIIAESGSEISITNDIKIRSETMEIHHLNVSLDRFELGDSEIDLKDKLKLVKSQIFIDTMCIPNLKVWTKRLLMYEVKANIKNLFFNEDTRLVSRKKVDIEETMFESNDSFKLLNLICRRTGLKKNRIWVRRYSFNVCEESLKNDPTTARKIRSYRKLKKYRKNRRYLLYLMNKLFYSITNSILAWAILSLCIIVLFALIYHSFADSLCFKDLNMNIEFVKYIYLSVGVFTSLGFGDIYPTKDITMIIVSFEAITGYLMLGVLLYILTRILKE